MVLMVMSDYCRPFSYVFAESTVSLVVDLTSLLFHNSLHLFLFFSFSSFFFFFMAIKLLWSGSRSQSRKEWAFIAGNGMHY